MKYSDELVKKLYPKNCAPSYENIVKNLIAAALPEEMPSDAQPASQKMNSQDDDLFDFLFQRNGELKTQVKESISEAKKSMPAHCHAVVNKIAKTFKEGARRDAFKSALIELKVERSPAIQGKSEFKIKSVDGVLKLSGDALSLHDSLPTAELQRTLRRILWVGAAKEQSPEGRLDKSLPEVGFERRDSSGTGGFVDLSSCLEVNTLDVLFDKDRLKNEVVEIKTPNVTQLCKWLVNKESPLDEGMKEKIRSNSTVSCTGRHVSLKKRDGGSQITNRDEAERGRGNGGKRLKMAKILSDSETFQSYQLQESETSVRHFEASKPVIPGKYWTNLDNETIPHDETVNFRVLQRSLSGSLLPPKDASGQETGARTSSPERGAPSR